MKAMQRAIFMQKAMHELGDGISKLSANIFSVCCNSKYLAKSRLPLTLYRTALSQSRAGFHSNATSFLNLTRFDWATY